MALPAFIRQLLLRDLQEVPPIFDIEAPSLRACVLIFFFLSQHRTHGHYVSSRLIGLKIVRAQLYLTNVIQKSQCANCG